MTAEGEIICPLCLEEMDITDQQLQPCTCGYEVCLWCWHHIMDTAEKGGIEGTCPACRIPYDKEKILGKMISSKRLEELNAEKRQKHQKSKSKALETRAHLGSCRVIQKNLVYLAGLPLNLADQKILQKKEFLGQYGKILKVVMTKTNTASQQFLSTNSCSVFVTFSKDEEAVQCIQALDGFIFDGRLLRASFGTTKYCEAWLKNMPCGNPHCVYMHEAGEQEDICPKEDVMSACASKVRQSCTTAFDNMQRRSGKFFPPPIQSFCSNTARNSAIVNPMLCHPIDYDRNIPPDGDHVKCGVNFNEASGLKVCSMISSSAQGTKVNRPTSRNHLPFSGGVLGDFYSLNLWEKNDLLSVENSGPNVGTDSVVEGFTNESSHIHKKTGKHCYADCRLVCQPSISMHGDVQCSSTGDSVASLVHSLNSRSFYSESSLVGGQTVTCKSKDNYASFLEASSSRSEPCGPSSQYFLSCNQQYASLSRESMRSSDDLEAKATCLSKSENRNVFASYNRNDSHFMVNKTNSYRPLSVITPRSSKGVCQNLFDMSSVHKEDDLELCCLEYGCQIAPLEKHIVPNTCISEKVKRDATEESIISDILSLDLVLGDSSFGDNLGKLLLDNDDETIRRSNLINTWNSRNNNASKFCFGRMDNSVTATKQKDLLGPDECKHDMNLNKLDMVKSYSVCQTQSFHNLAVSDHSSEGTASLCHCPNEHVAESMLHSTSHQSGLPLPLPQVTSAPRFAFGSRALNFRPHDFFPQYTAPQDNSFSMLSDSGSSALSQHTGNSVHWSYSPQVAAEDSCTDISHICPTVAYSHVPQSSRMDSFYYSSPELDHRVSKFGVGGKTQSLEGNEYSLQDLVRNSSRTSDACKSAGTAVTTTGPIGLGTQSGLAEIMDSRRVGFIN